jgi:hypothetical protein
MGETLTAVILILVMVGSVAAVAGAYIACLVVLRAYGVMIMQAELAHFFWPLVAVPFTIFVLPLIYFLGQATASDVLWTACMIPALSVVCWFFGEIGHTVLIAITAALDVKRGRPLLNPVLAGHLQRNLNRWPRIYSTVGRHMGVDRLAERWQPLLHSPQGGAERNTEATPFPW